MILDEYPDGTATLILEEYGDLLKARTLSEWHMIAEEPPTVATTSACLLTSGLTLTEDKVKDWLPIAEYLFDYQQWIVKQALARQRFAVFADCGLGKTPIQLEWARQVRARTNGRVLIVAPLQVVAQTIEEARRFYGDELALVDLSDSRERTLEWCASGDGVGITNYEKIDGLELPLNVAGVVLDESSVLKSSMGVRRTSLIAAFRGIGYKLCCSATPAPNDRVEYGEHAYFLDVVRSTREFLARFFVNRDGEWQLKHHGVEAFYRHLASWSVFMRDPAAFHFVDNRRALPPMRVEYPHVGSTAEQMAAAREHEAGAQPSLFGATPGGITSRTKMMQIAHGFVLGETMRRFPTLKPDAIAELVNVTHADEPVIIWVTFDEEGEQLARMIPDAQVIAGKTAKPKRNEIIEAFRRGESPRVLIAKPSMLGFGLNFQACRVQVFSTLTDSFERFYQATRRSYRYGQEKEVLIYVPVTAFDQAMIQNVMSKERVWIDDATRQEAAYAAILRPRDTSERRIMVSEPQSELDRATGENWTMIHADSIAHMPTMADESMDLAVFSPPFANLFTYSSDLADMGNVRQDGEYRLQWRWFAERLLPIMKPGRVVAVHCMDVIRFAGQHGYRHTYDYPSDLRAGMQDAGFLYRARIAIDKNPQIQATRTKDANLLFATLKRNALDSHPQASECVLVFTVPGDPAVPVIANEISNQEWIAWAHHVWYGIRETDVLNAALGKEHDDERHICPLQLSLIERCVRLWTNPGETVFSPFAGIGSEGWESLGWDRKFYGVELKKSYFDTACRFLTEREESMDARLPLEMA